MSLTESAIETEDYGAGFYRVILRYGFMEEINVPGSARPAQELRAELQDDGHQLLPRPPDPARLGSRPGMAIWREKLFAWMLRNAESAMEFFKLPTNRVVELGSQVEI